MGGPTAWPGPFTVHDTRRDEVHRVAALAGGDQPLIGDREARPQQPRHAIELIRRQPGQQLHVGDERPRVQSEIEMRPALDPRARRLQIAAERAEKLRADQPLIEERPVLEVLAPEGDAIEEALLEQVRVRAVLRAQRFERRVGHLLPLPQGAAHRLGRSLADERRQRLADVRRDFFEDDAADEETLEAIGQPIDQRLLDPQPPVEDLREPDLPRELDGLLGGLHVLAVPARARALDQPVHVLEQLLDDPAGRRAGSKVLEHELALAAGERDQSEPHRAVSDLGPRRWRAARRPTSVGTSSRRSR